MEKAYAERDNYRKPVEGVVKLSSDLLLSVHTKTSKKLGDYGFEVNNTLKPKKDDGSKPA